MKRSRMTWMWCALLASACSVGSAELPESERGAAQRSCSETEVQFQAQFSFPVLDTLASYKATKQQATLRLVRGLLEEAQGEPVTLAAVADMTALPSQTARGEVSLPAEDLLAQERSAVPLLQGSVSHNKFPADWGGAHIAGLFAEEPDPGRTRRVVTALLVAGKTDGAEQPYTCTIDSTHKEVAWLPPGHFLVSASAGYQEPALSHTAGTLETGSSSPLVIGETRTSAFTKFEERSADGRVVGASEVSGTFFTEATLSSDETQRNVTLSLSGCPERLRTLRLAEVALLLFNDGLSLLAADLVSTDLP